MRVLPGTVVFRPYPLAEMFSRDALREFAHAHFLGRFVLVSARGRAFPGTHDESCQDLQSGFTARLSNLPVPLSVFEKKSSW